MAPLRAYVCAAALLLGACGRIGFEEFYVGPDGVPFDAGVGGTAGDSAGPDAAPVTDASAPGDAATGGSGGADPDAATGGDAGSNTGGVAGTPPDPGSCGDGVIDSGEECDDGAPSATCDADCHRICLTADATCNGVDDDCDGTEDEDWGGAPTSCGVGACAGNVGVTTCVAGVPGDSCDPFAGAAANDATCDGVDDDCDGPVDEDAATPGDWWNLAYPYRTKLSFDHASGDSDLDDFPVLVVLDSGWFDYGHTELDGHDLRFVDDNHAIELTYHIEQWTPGGSSYVWVRVPTIDAFSSSDHIWMYYGADFGNVENETGTYSGDYRAVFHLDETGGSHTDSAGGITCNWVGGGTGWGDDGQVGDGISLDGVDDGCNSGANVLVGVTDHTLTGWMRPRPTGGDDAQQTIFSGESLLAGPWSGPSFYMRDNGNLLGSWVANGYRWSTSANALIDDQWNFVALRADSDGSAGWVQVRTNNGPWETIRSGDTTTVNVIADSIIQIGNWTGPTECQVNGWLDEIQVHGVIRGDAWIDATYRSQGNLGFVAADPEEQTCP